MARAFFRSRTLVARALALLAGGSLRLRSGAGSVRPPCLAVGQLGFVYRFSRFEGGVAFVDLVPVEDVPPGGEIFGTAVVVFQVVGVLPDVVAEDGIEALRDWVVMIRSGDDLHFAAGFSSEPDPSAAELLDTGVVEFGLKIFEVAEGSLDHVGYLARRITSAFGLHNLPEHAVIDVTSAIVPDGGAYVLGNGVEVAD